MGRHLEDPDYGFPVASLGGSRTVLFDNGVIGFSSDRGTRCFTRTHKIDYGIKRVMR